METEATIRRQGNSVGVALPPAILRLMGFSVGQTVSLQATPDGLLIKAKRTRPTAAELNAQCNLKAPMPDDLQAWENMRPAGSER
ncbi:AbrB/MazE/SpoVT family DNA-binding domain-containing protein [Rugamonas rivuli]|uniref:PbsX family transcriptional regulator n=1 Tax=Rugamonas rivuli TaxID=2743358 RepID=A0A843SL04_9BURK|nr:AbrB/MazE/SpoVT family DNA-binding domain-containing protein [Rugamonas rivuli]MQA21447.1 PbsX family transcriptional regulator [Rugamonas rivuli]